MKTTFTFKRQAITLCFACFLFLVGSLHASAVELYENGTNTVAQGEQVGLCKEQINTDSLSQKAPFFIEATVRYGRLISNNSPIKDYAYATPGFDIAVGKQSIGLHDYEQYCNYPRYGLAFQYNKCVLPAADTTIADYGDRCSLYGFIDFPLWTSGRWTLYFQPGLGLAFWTKPADKKDVNSVGNMLNECIGSVVNVHIDLAMLLSFNLTEQWNVVAGGQFFHSSNGALKRPNFGLNAPTVLLGLGYQFNEGKRPTYIHKVYDPYIRQNEIYMFLAPGVRQSKATDAYYFSNTLEVGYGRLFSPIWRWNAGVDFCYDGDFQNYIGKEKKGKFKNSIGIAPFAGLEAAMHRVALSVALAGYAYRPSKGFEAFYERAGVKYLIGKEKQAFVGVSVKAHAGSVEFIEWTVGTALYRWKD